MSRSKRPLKDIEIPGPQFSVRFILANGRSFVSEFSFPEFEAAQYFGEIEIELARPFEGDPYEYDIVKFEVVPLVVCLMQ